MMKVFPESVVGTTLHFYIIIEKNMFTKYTVILILKESVNHWNNKLSTPFFSGVRVTRSLILCVCFIDLCLSFFSLSLAIVLSIPLRFTDSDYPFGIFNLFILLTGLH